MSSFFRSSHDSESPLISSSFATPTKNNSDKNKNRKKKKKKKSGFASAALRGLGCASSASSEAHVPSAAAVRSSAGWQEGRRPSGRRTRPPPVHHRNSSDDQRAAMAAADAGADDDEEEEEDSFDCFMARHHPMIMMHHRAGPYDAERFHREMMKFQTRIPDGLLTYDRYRDLRLDVDRMSYEELLELGDRIGHVSTGLREDEISQSLRKMKHSVFVASCLQISSEMERKCSICQEEYQVDEDIGKLECGHSYHMYCIKQWLLQKNTCPVCKTTAVAKT